MLWFPLAVATALFNTLEAAWLKRAFSHLNPFEAAMVPSVLALPLFAGLLVFLDVPELSPQYWTTFALLLPANLIGTLLYFRGISLSPLSVTLPYLSFTPAFALVTGWLILGEVPNLWGAAGVLLIVGGSYLLNIRARTNGDLWAPFKAIVAAPGARSMLGAALVYALSSVLGRKGILESDPLFFASSFFLVQGLVMLVLLPGLGLARLSALRVEPRKGALLALFMFGEIVCHCLAISMVKAAYMISVKRLNAVFGVILGGLWLKEQGMAARLAGAALMCAGAAVIGLLGH